MPATTFQGSSGLIRRTSSVCSRKRLRSCSGRFRDHEVEKGASNLNRVRAMSSRIEPQAHLPLIVQVQPVERALGRQAGRGGVDPEALVALRSAVPQIRTKGKVLVKQPPTRPHPSLKWSVRPFQNGYRVSLGTSMKAQGVETLLAYRQLWGKQHFPNGR